MIGLSVLLSFSGFLFTLALWFFALFISKNHMNPIGIFSGYPAQVHMELSAGLFFLPILTIILKDRGLIKSPLKILTDRALISAFIILQIILFALSFIPEKRLYFHIALFSYAALLWLSVPGNLSHDAMGKSIDDFFSLALLFALSGSGLWILFDLSSFSNAYLAGKILLIYGAMNLVFFGLFPSLAGNKLNLKNFRWFIYLYTGSLLYEAVLMIFLKERPPVIIGNGIRLSVSAYWFFAMSDMTSVKRLNFRNVILWFITLFHLTGLAGLTFLSETGIHYGHLYLAGAITPVLLFSLPAFRTGDAGRLEGRMTYAIFGLIFFAALTRATAHLMPENNQSHLAYASFVMTAALFFFLHRYRKVLF